MKTKLWYLQNVELFKELNKEEMETLDRITTMSSAKKKEPIYLPGDPSRQVYLLKLGRIKISRITEDGNEITFRRSPISLAPPGRRSAPPWESSSDRSSFTSMGALS